MIEGTLATATATTLVGALVTAGALGVSHAIEPDHVAGIASLTSRYGDARLSALVGACFSLGHVALVVAWLGLAAIVLGRTSFGPTAGATGTVAAGVVLGVLGASMVAGGLRRIVRTDAHEHGPDGTVHSHAHVRLPDWLPLIGGRGHGRETYGTHGHEHDRDHDHDRGVDADGNAARSDHDGHDHGIETYLTTGLVGALFTLSPPVSMIVFASTLLPAHGTGVVSLAVVAYAVAITAMMSLLGAGVGAAFGLTGRHGRQVQGGLRAVAGVAIVGLAGSLLVGAVPVLL